ncbi:MAG TPA: zf-HC2 domain-containing protein [Vicinamibacteria bacterium]|jgi:anti-sigma factor RsiW
MSCASVRRRFSSFRDRDLPGAQARTVEVHLAACPACASRWRQYTAALDGLGSAPRLHSPDGIAQRVLARLEVETRGPGLALLYRPAWAARPLILPSLVTALLVFAGVIAGALALDRPEPLPEVATASLPPWEASAAPWGTEGNPRFPVSGVGVPRARPGLALPPEVLAALGDDTLFVETVVARDGSVSAVNLLQGDLERARGVLEALRQARFEPTLLNGRPVAVSVYRLISALEVRAHVT